MEFERLAAIVAEVMNLDVSEIKMDTSFVEDLGADSLDMFQILIAVEEELQSEVDPEAAEKVKTIGDVLKLTGAHGEV